MRMYTPGSARTQEAQEWRALEVLNTEGDGPQNRHQHAYVKIPLSQVRTGHTYAVRLPLSGDRGAE